MGRTHSGACPCLGRALTIHPSRTRFTARLNPGVWAHASTSSRSLLFHAVGLQFDLADSCTRRARSRLLQTTFRCLGEKQGRCDGSPGRGFRGSEGRSFSSKHHQEGRGRHGCGNCCLGSGLHPITLWAWTLTIRSSRTCFVAALCAWRYASAHHPPRPGSAQPRRQLP